MASRKFTPIECTALESLGAAEARWKILKVLVGSRGLEEGYAEVGTNCPHLELVASWLAGWLPAVHLGHQHASNTRTLSTQVRRKRAPLSRKSISKRVGWRVEVV